METHYYDTPNAGPFKNRYNINQFYSAYINLPGENLLTPSKFPILPKNRPSNLLFFIKSN